MGLVIQTTYP